MAVYGPVLPDCEPIGAGLVPPPDEPRAQRARACETVRVTLERQFGTSIFVASVKR